jgi:hypothetical protein
VYKSQILRQFYSTAVVVFSLLRLFFGVAVVFDVAVEQLFGVLADVL